MTEPHAVNGSRLLTVDTLIKVVLLIAAVILSYQRVQDRQDFLDSRTHSLELWQDTERQIVISLDRRLAVLERDAAAAAAAGSVTLRRR